MCIIICKILPHIDTVVDDNHQCDVIVPGSSWCLFQMELSGVDPVVLRLLTTESPVLEDDFPLFLTSCQCQQSRGGVFEHRI